jgi:arsenate reductase
VTGVPEILYVCTHNAGRSVAAAVLTEHHARGRVTVRSAGSQPGREVNPAVAEVLRERGLDPDQQFPKPLTDERRARPTSSSRWGVETRAPSFPASAISVGSSPIPAE